MNIAASLRDFMDNICTRMRCASPVFSIRCIRVKEKSRDTIPLLPGRYTVPVSITLEKLADTVVTGHSTFRNACLANCRAAVPPSKQVDMSREFLISPVESLELLEYPVKTRGMSMLCAECNRLSVHRDVFHISTIWYNILSRERNSNTLLVTPLMLQVTFFYNGLFSNGVPSFCNYNNYVVTFFR